MRTRFFLFLLPLAFSSNLGAQTVGASDLTRLVRQDCGSCHGMKLTGGLGTPLTREALAGRSPQSLTATILYGRPGTTMPAWKSLLTVAQAEWIAARLLEGFPEEAR